ncbi:MAG: hypothetical protein SPF89_12050 [Sphaerochaetaceae bacterium]|nr:hypothetical protein [Spirochaetales bacterium]MDY5500826.1 hypothetical protein [Sphaerochaetaceae bacterium]
MMEGPEVTTISSFGELREKGALYVDKPSYLARLIMGKDKLFSRPPSLREVPDGIYLGGDLPREA